jgi:peptide/nickel transport system substrate-binding protein
MFNLFRKPVRTAFAALIASSSLVAIGSGVLSSSASAASNTTDVTYALLPATVPNYILPLMGPAYYSNVNLYQFQAEMYRPLYWFGNGTKPTFNSTLSLAKTPVYSNGGKTVTITMKPYKWSDGTAVTSEDVLFFMQMLKAEKKIWPIYVVGEFPDNIVSMSAPNASTVVFHLDKAYSQTWMLYNELSQITPFPAEAWDKESTTGKIGNRSIGITGDVCDKPALAGRRRSVQVEDVRDDGVHRVRKEHDVLGSPAELRRTDARALYH